MTTGHAFTVSDLAGAQVDATASDGPAVLKALAWVGRIFAAPVARHLDERARKIASSAIWFQGALVSLPQDHERLYSDAETEQALLRKMEHAETQLMSIRAMALNILLDLEEIGPRSGSGLRQAFRNLAVATADAFEAMQAFKWAMMERNADNDIASGRVKTFDTAEDLLASLKR